MKKFFKWLFILILIAIFGGLALFFMMGIRTANEYEARHPMSSLVEQVETKPDYVPYEYVNPTLYQATIAIEDARFYKHDAVDVKSLLRAAASQVVPFIPRSGGSTIDMQTVKNLYGQYEGSAVWKAGEIVLATRLDKLCTKEEIMSLYVNIINYGNNFHSISEASMGYYGVTPDQLTDAEAILLAGIPQAPEAFNPITNFDAAKRKQKLVLDAMVRNEMISQEQADALYEEDVRPLQIRTYALIEENNASIMSFSKRMTQILPAASALRFALRV